MTEEQINKELYSSGNFGTTEDYYNEVQKFLTGTKTNGSFTNRDGETVQSKDKLYLNDYMYQREANIFGRDFGLAENIDKDGNTVHVHHGGNLDYDIQMIMGGATKEGDYKIASDVPYVDTEWAMSKFLAPLATLASAYRTDAFHTWALTKTGDASLGNSQVINPLPQFTRYADPRITTDPSKMGVKRKSGSRGLDYDVANDVTYGTVKFANGLGMGRYYSEALEDYQQEVYMQFGVPEFNSMFSFLTSAVSYEDTYIANHGRYPIEFGVSSWAGARLTFAIYPFISLAVYAVQSLYRLVVGFSPFTYYYLKPNMTGYWGTVNTIVSTFCVELGIFTMDLVDAGSKVVTGKPATETETDTYYQKVGLPVQFNELEMMELKTLLPGLFGDKTSYVDMYKLATTHQIINSRVKNEWAIILENNGTRVQNVLLGAFVNDEGISAFGGDDITSAGANLYQEYQGGGFDAFGRAYEYVGKTLDGWFNEFTDLLDWFWNGGLSSSFFNSWDQMWTSITGGDYVESENLSGFFGGETDKAKELVKEANKAAQSKNKSSDSNSSDTNSDFSSILKKASINSVNNTTSDKIKEELKDKTVDENTRTLQKVGDSLTKWYSAGAEVVNAVNRDGGLFVGFRVNTTRSASESFSNSTAPISTGELIKGVSGTARNLKFDLSGGNLLPGMDDVLNAAKNVALGVLDGATFGLSSAIASALSGAFIDIPDRWESSSASLSNVTYSVRLVAPYGNPISQLQNIYIPLSCLLAGVLPLQTGRASHTSPYICNLFCKGVQNIELGIITELSIERGVSNLPFSKWKQPLAIDVSFTVTDLSGIITAPVDRGIFQAILKGPTETIGQLTTESKLDDYIGTLCARDLNNSRFLLPAFQRRMKKALLRTGQIFNSNRTAFFLGEATNKIAAVFGAPAWSAQMATKNANILGKGINVNEM